MGIRVDISGAIGRKKRRSLLGRCQCGRKKEKGKNQGACAETNEGHERYSAECRRNDEMEGGRIAVVQVVDKTACACLVINECIDGRAKRFRSRRFELAGEQLVDDL